MPIRTFLVLLLGLKRKNLIKPCEQETFALVLCCSNLMVLSLKNQL
ncbi:hypothetical protein MXB_2583 [Myxobolus squamalis]|nr:hypothetical protein MXB_2583 [Myxobolus squamalis]